MQLRISRLAALAAVPLLLSACGGGGETGEAGAAPTMTKSAATLVHAPAIQADAYEEVVQNLYIAYFGRPADTGGLQASKVQLLALHAPADTAEFEKAYHRDASLRLVVDSFAMSAESNALYQGKEMEAFVEAIYKHLFNRAPDAAGKAFWAAEIRTGRLSRPAAALSILAGARDADRDTIRAKNKVASMFSASLDTSVKAAAYRGQFAIDAVRDSLLAGVGAGTDLAQAQALIDRAVAALVTAADPLQNTTPAQPGVPEVTLDYNRLSGYHILGLASDWISIATPRSGTVELYDNDRQVATLTAPVLNNRPADLSSVELSLSGIDALKQDGTHRLTARMRNADGTLSPASQPRQYKISTRPATLLGLDLPSTVLAGSGKDFYTVRARAAETAVGSVVLTFDKPFATGFPAPNDKISTLSVFNYANQAPNDVTPLERRSMIALPPVQQPGRYTLTKVEVWDWANGKRSYSADELRAMGFNTSFMLSNQAR